MKELPKEGSSEDGKSVIALAQYLANAGLRLAQWCFYFYLQWIHSSVKINNPVFSLLWICLSRKRGESDKCGSK